MILFKKALDLNQWLDKQRASGNSIGFVPTLGALHAGHISLIDISKTTTSVTVCSIFVNPTQFNDPRDFQKYPITLEQDIVLLEQAGTDVLFLPEVAEMYPNGTKDLEKYNLGRLEQIFEGQYRPGHFQGVCQVMRRLLQLVKPDHLFMGQKDYQQCMVVQRLLEIMEFKTTLHRCPIVREADGLAMSSRNMRLNPTERQQATALYRALSRMKDEYTAGPPRATDPTPWLAQLKKEAKSTLNDAKFRVDYVEIVDGETLEQLPETAAGPAEKAKNTGAVVLVAAFLGEVRLIDNMML